MKYLKRVVAIIFFAPIVFILGLAFVMMNITAASSPGGSLVVGSIDLALMGAGLWLVLDWYEHR